jgi:outer membrane receptor protein involved in Fe transport
VCPALCEGACTAGLNGQSVTVREIERFISDMAWEKGWVENWKITRNGKKVAVIGSGPAGLAAANALNLAGNQVTVYEKADRPGGLMMYGIPNMKLPKNIVMRRIKFMTEQGVSFLTNAGIGTSPVFQAGSALIRRPAHSARLGVELRPAARIRTFANLVITGRRDDVDFRPFPAERVTLPTVATIELAGDVDLIEARGGRPGIGLRLRVENLLNREYESIVGFPGRRRNVLVGVRARF